MKSIDNTNTSTVTKGKITLRDYYNGLPDARQVAPRKELIIEVATKCGVPFWTARSWLAYGNVPRNKKHLEVLSEITGIALEDLYDK